MEKKKEEALEVSSAVVESPSVILIIIPASEVCFGHDFSVQIYFPME